MMEYLELRKSNCKNCYRCIRSCPVKSIRFSDNQAHILPEECILCGRCFTVCPQNAKVIRGDVPRARELMREGPVVASVAPSFIAHFPSLPALEKALKQLGFQSVEETALGATIVKKQYENDVRVRDVTLSSCCSTVNLLIQRYYPEALPLLSHLLSPMQAHCMDIKRRAPEAKTVFIGPCISKKAEAERYPGVVDCVLTFEELSGWMEREGVTTMSAAQPAQEDTGRARLFPSTGGIIGCMDKEPGVEYFAVDGIENCVETLQDVIDGKLKHCFIELSACVGSCLGGPAMPRESTYRPIRDALAVRNFAGARDFEVAAYDQTALHKDFSWSAPHRVRMGESAVEEVLRKIGKTSPDKELNCGGCGYNTCREKARAVLEGKADLNMCLPYLHERASSFSDTIIQNTPNAIFVLNEALELQQINRAACELMNIKNQQDVLGSPVIRILDPIPFLEAMEGNPRREARVYLPEYQKHVTQTVLFDANYRIVICIMRDVTESVLQKREKEALGRTTIETADRVIEKQMRSVQEIASLLGETAAETKIALTKLKESLRDG